MRLSINRDAGRDAKDEGRERTVSQYIFANGWGVNGGCMGRYVSGQLGG